MKSIHIIIGLLLSLFFVGCSDEEEIKPDPGPAKRTVLMYIAGDNNLSNFGKHNISAAVEGAKQGGLNGGNLLVYYDSRSSNPLLMQIKEQGIDTLEVYPDQNSADPTVMRTIIEGVVTDFPAESYGLVLWSHGTAWLPSNFTSMLRSFGQDNSEWMEINELAAALPDHIFDFILFDACYMGSIEVVYEMRNKAKQIIASPIETLADGFPYADIIRPMFSDTPDLEQVCTAFYAYYNRQSGLNRSASVSLSATQHIEALASLVAEILQNETLQEIYNLPHADIQPYDYLLRNIHLLYDFDDCINRLATPEQYARFQTLLSQVVLYKQSTPQATYGLSGNPRLDIIHFSGLSLYLPQEGYEALTEWYIKNTEWGKKTLGSLYPTPQE